MWAQHPLNALISQRRRLSTLVRLHRVIRSGVPLTTGLLELGRGGGAEARQWQQVARYIEAGGTLAEGLRRQSGLLDPVTVELVGVGETVGALEPLLARREAQAEHLSKLTARALKKLGRPLRLLGLAVFVGPLLGLGAAMAERKNPLLAYLSQVGHNVGGLALASGCIIGLPFVLERLGLLPRTTEALARLPLVGGAVGAGRAARLLSSLGAAIRGGLDVERSLRLAFRAAGGTSSEAQAELALGAIQKGGTLTEALKRCGLVPPPLLAELAIGETTGTLDQSLDRAADQMWERFVSRAERAGTALVVLCSIPLLAAVALQLARGFQQYLHQIDLMGRSDVDP